MTKKQFDALMSKLDAILERLPVEVPEDEFTEDDARTAALGLKTTKEEARNIHEMFKVVFPRPTKYKVRYYRIPEEPEGKK